MIISDDIKTKIQAEYDTWQAEQYAGKDKKDRQVKGQFFTPPPLSIKMLEKFNSLDGNILDPTLGAGGLIAAAVLAGADQSKCYGIELDPDILKIAQLRLAKLGVPPWHLKQGDALDQSSYEFEEDKIAQFAVVAKFKDCVKLMVVSKSKLVKEVNFTGRTKDKLKTALQKLKEKKIKIVKL